MAETLVERLRDRMDEMGLKAKAVATLAGVGPSFVYDILLKRSTNPTTEKLGRVASVLNTSVEYLLNGSATAQSGGIRPSRDSSYTPVPFVTVNASMGGGALVEDESQATPWLFPKQWISKQLMANARHLRLIQVSGDSMEPTLENRDVVLFDLTRISYSQGGVFVLNDGLGLVVKRVEYIPNSPEPRVQIISDNPHYPRYERPAEDIRIIGKVVWFGRRVG